MSPLRVGSLCTGYGGLDHAVLAALGGELVWVSDPDPGAAALLAHRHPGVPNLGDLTVVDWAAVEPADVITAGWPCQPWSHAGRRKGAEDARAIWPEIAAAIRAVRPRLVLLENVGAIVAAGELSRACGDLAEAGYVGSWRSLRASDVGAPHRRERIFIVAVAAADAADVGHQRGRGARGRWARSADRGRPAVTDTDSQSGRLQPVSITRSGSTPDPGSDREAAAGEGRQGARPEPARRGFERSGRIAADSDGERFARRSQCDGGPHEPGQQAPLGDDADGRVLDWGDYGPAIERWSRTLGRPAPAPTVLGVRGGHQLNARFVEWMMGLPDGWVCDVPGLTRSQRLKLLGNGVVPLQAEAAIRHLLPLLNEPEVAA